jgi:hypothetical protein
MIPIPFRGGRVKLHMTDLAHKVVSGFPPRDSARGFLYYFACTDGATSGVQKGSGLAGINWVVGVLTGAVLFRYDVGAALVVLQACSIAIAMWISETVDDRIGKARHPQHRFARSHRDGTHM